MMLNEARKTLNEEEEQDNGLRAANGPKWTPIPSNTMNGAYKQHIETYGQKIDQAKGQDQMSFQKFQDQKPELEILSKTPNELVAMMPVSDTAQAAAENPVSMAIK